MKARFSLRLMIFHPIKVLNFASHLKLVKGFKFHLPPENNNIAIKSKSVKRWTNYVNIFCVN